MRSLFLSIRQKGTEFWRKCTEAPDSLPAERRRSFEIMAEIYLLAFCLQLAVAPVLYLVDRPLLGGLNLLCLAGYVVALVLHRRLFVATALTIKLSTFLIFVIIGIAITADSSSLIYYLLFAEVELMLADLRRRTKILATGCLITLSFGVLHLPPLHDTARSLSTVDMLLSDLGLGLVFVMLCVVILRMLTITDRHEYRYRRDAMHDSLTRVLNRRAIFERASFYWRAQRDFVVVLVDADHFKDINDNHGHTAGDAVLRHLARLLRQSLRDEDSVGRVGGEEFLLLLPDTSKHDAIAAAMRIRKRLALQPCRFDGIELPVTLSMGIATSDEGLHLRDLIELADRRLYAAKDAGRDRMVTEGFADKTASDNAERLVQGVERALETSEA
ncbi:GGDEF domain-containing protein [Salinicola salarius]|uniref:GGDEF domain-containing protein n=1 Tax=Salinicola salarius TaxID=430457 RepID=UPI0026EAA94C|nr:GGDEF domain-containing protein [Salinicola salarius]